MLERINGYNESGRLGYFYGKNTFISVAVANGDKIYIKDTGAVASYVEIKRFLNTKDDAVALKYVNERKIVRVDGTEFELATFEADYNEAFYAQTNMKRIVDIIQQRSVILSVSDIATDVMVDEFINTPDGKYTVDAKVANATVISFLVERAYVFDRDINTFQGVPTGKRETGRILVDELSGISLLDKDGKDISLKSSVNGGDEGNFAIKTFLQTPALY